MSHDRTITRQQWRMYAPAPVRADDRKFPRRAVAITSTSPSCSHGMRAGIPKVFDWPCCGPLESNCRQLEARRSRLFLLEEPRLSRLFLFDKPRFVAASLFLQRFSSTAVSRAPEGLQEPHHDDQTERHPMTLKTVATARRALIR